MELEKPIIQNQFIKYKYENEEKCIKIPLGSISSNEVLKNYCLFYDEDVNKLTAISVNRHQEVEILPLFEELNRFSYGDSTIEIRVSEVIAEDDMFIGNSIIACTHYLKPPYKGLMIKAEFVDGNDKSKILSSKSMSNIEKSISNVSNIIGVVIVDRMNYSKPKGRIKIAEELHCEKYGALKRNEIVSKLKVSWLSRIAILSPYQNLGIGKILAEVAGKVVSKKVIPSSNFIEVFTTQNVEQAQQIIDGKKSGIFINAGYTVYEELLSSKPMFDKNTNLFFKTKKLYYYKKVGEEMDVFRLFVPLSSEPYTWFESGKKEWELRRYGRQYTDNNIKVGRLVELRQGYSNPENALWGIIVDSKICDTLSDVFGSINYKKILPTAENQEKANESAADILNLGKHTDSKFIAFKVKIVSQAKDLQILNISDLYTEAICCGKKKSTIRFGERSINKGKCILSTNDIVLAVEVTGVKYKKYQELDMMDAELEGYSSVEELKNELSKYYSDIQEQDVMTIIEFEYINLEEYTYVN